MYERKSYIGRSGGTRWTKMSGRRLDRGPNISKAFIGSARKLKTFTNINRSSTHLAAPERIVIWFDISMIPSSQKLFLLLSYYVCEEVLALRLF